MRRLFCIFILLSSVLLGTTTAQEEVRPDDFYEPYTIQTLAARAYGGGQVQAVEVMAETRAFNRYLIRYPSDDLTIYGFMNVPNNVPSPYPVIIAVHGYINPSRYGTLDYTTRYADALARAGYLVLHPNLRNYSPSDSAPRESDHYRVGMALDVLHLAAIVRDTAGQAGALRLADPDRIGLWGHSMGGGISIRAMTVDQTIDAVVLYGSMSADETQNYRRIKEWSDGERGDVELNTPPIHLLEISPIFHLERVQAAVSIHHGSADTTVPPEWSEQLCAELRALGKTVECFSYSSAPHTFRGRTDNLFIERMISFYDTYLR